MYSSCTILHMVSYDHVKEVELTLKDLIQICRLAGTQLGNRGLVPQSRLSVPSNEMIVKIESFRGLGHNPRSICIHVN
jgi:hypothetical protein